MTLIKNNERAQAVVEYFLMTSVIVLLFLGFLRVNTFNKVKKTCEKTFDSAVDLITGGNGGSNETNNTTNNATTK